MITGRLADPEATTTDLVAALTAAGQDFEWYPTTPRMVAAITARFSTDRHDAPRSFLDIGAGDGRVLLQLAGSDDAATLYAIEKSAILQQRQPDRIIPVGCDFAEQNLMGLPVDVAFCNPPYSEFEAWAYRLISTVYARQLFLVIPQRWQGSTLIVGALAARSATADVIHEDDFLDGARRARARVHVVRVRFEKAEQHYYGRRDTPAQDPFDLWFDQHIDTFDREAPLDEDASPERRLARLRALDSIPALVEAFDEEHARLEANYRAIFRLDGALLQEVGVSKASVREGLKAKISGLKNTYWTALFDRLDTITSRLTTATKRTFLARLTGQTAIAFTCDNAYAVVLWAIKAANAYFDSQTVALFKALATREGATNYVSNQRTFEQDRWRYLRFRDEFSHYTLDYRIVVPHHAAIGGGWDYPGGLHTSAHEQVEDAVAVFGNLGFRTVGRSSRARTWERGQWQDFCDASGDVVFQVKAFQNGHLQWRMRPAAMMALNIEAGRLLGWVRSAADVVTEMGYSADDAARYFDGTQRLGASAVRLLEQQEARA